MTLILRKLETLFRDELDRPPWLLKPGVTCVTGDTGTGKSLLANLIVFSLGAEIALTDYVKREFRRVRLLVAIAGDEVVLERRSPGPNAVVYVTENGTTRTLRSREWSTELLTRLGFTQEELVAAARARESEVPTLTHLVSLLFLSQGVIDQPPSALVGERKHERAVRALLDVALRMSAGRLGDLRNEVALTRDAIRRDTRRLTVLGALLDQLSFGSVVTVLREALLDVEHNLTVARAEDAAKRRAQGAARRRRSAAARRIDRAIEDRARAELQIESLREQYDELLTETFRLAAEPPPQQHPDTCPECHRALAGLHRPAGSCAVCGRSGAATTRARAPLAPLLENLAAERRSLRAQLRLWDDRRAAAQRRHDDAHADFNAANGRDMALENELNPVRNTIFELLKAHDALTQALQAAEEREALVSAQAARKGRMRRLREEIAAEYRRLADQRAWHTTLSDIYRELLCDLRAPGDHSRSTIDLADHLPKIAGRPIDEHGPGGTASFSRIAYLLAHVIYAHDFAHLSGLPCLALIDTPRKDHGTGDDARRRSVALIALLNVLNSKHTRDRPLQIFIFDGSMSQRRLHRTRDLTRIRLDGPVIRPTAPPASSPQ